MKLKLLVLLCVGALVFVSPSCSKKSGCPDLTKPSRKKSKKGGTNLFDKKMRRHARTR